MPANRSPYLRGHGGFTLRSRLKVLIVDLLIVEGFLAGYVPPEVTNLTLHLPWMRRGGGLKTYIESIE